MPSPIVGFRLIGRGDGGGNAGVWLRFKTGFAPRHRALMGIGRTS